MHCCSYNPSVHQGLQVSGFQMFSTSPGGKNWQWCPFGCHSRSSDMFFNSKILSETSFQGTFRLKFGHC
uniref:Urease accessory protein ureD n=1 Tax=Rhizophora mucronata TaxID=61149 RepID=A0A2P2JBK9_RHIMU